MGGLRVLITNITLATRTGTETYVRDLATALRDQGHASTVYCPELGEIAWELQAAAVPVTDDLDALDGPPDVIHGHHNLATTTACLHFPRTPTVFVCHDPLAWHDSPPWLPSILRYVAVDLACRDRLALRHGIPEERVRVVLNFVDLERFKPRDPLPPRPKRGLVFSNYASDRTHLPAVRAACDRAGIALDVIGAGAGIVCSRPEELLGCYDIVFAKGRSALEALAVGAAVVVCDAAGLGPMVTAGELERLRPLNFSFRTLREPVEPAVLVREIARYDPHDAARVSRQIRVAAGRDAAVHEFVALYYDVLAEWEAKSGYAASAKDRAAAYLQLLGWRLMRRYGRVKYRFLMPAYRRLLPYRGQAGKPLQERRESERCNL